MATRRAERTTLLPGPPRAAWDAVMSPDVAPVIDPAVREWRPDRKPIDVGTRFTIRGRVGPLPIRGASEVVQWEPPQRAMFRSVQGSGPMDVTATHTFEPSDDGTLYTWRIEFDGFAPVAACAAWLFGRAIERQHRTLASYLERQDEIDA